MLAVFSSSASFTASATANAVSESATTIPVMMSAWGPGRSLAPAPYRAEGPAPEAPGRQQENAGRADDA